MITNNVEQLKCSRNLKKIKFNPHLLCNINKLSDTKMSRAIEK
jgi:hypothetical protein